MHSRRRMLRAGAVLLSGGAAGALVGNRIATDATAADADAGLAVSGDDVEVRDGDLAAVWLDLDVAWQYSAPNDESPDSLAIDVLAGALGEDMTVVDSTTDDAMFLESNGEESVEVDLLDASVLDSDALVPDTEGDTQTTDVHVGVEFRVTDSDDLVIAADSDTATATLEVELSDYDPTEHGSVGGSGELTVDIG